MPHPCPNCGNENLNTANICQVCKYDYKLGAVIKLCPACNVQNIDSSSICKKCGYDFRPNICPICNQKNGSRSTLCSNCGLNFYYIEFAAEFAAKSYELKGLFKSNFINKNQYEKSIVKLLDENLTNSISLVNANFFLGQMQKLERQKVIDNIIYEKISGNVLEKCSYDLKQKVDRQWKEAFLVKADTQSEIAEEKNEKINSVRKGNKSKTVAEDYEKPTITCRHCGAENFSYKLICDHCRYGLTSNTNE